MKNLLIKRQSDIEEIIFCDRCDIQKFFKGINFIEVLERFFRDPKIEGIVMIG
jgi:hypothetical protein